MWRGTSRLALGGPEPDCGVTVSESLEDIEQDSIKNVSDNLAFNRERWGNEDFWNGKDQFGYRWGGGHQQTVGDIALLADEHLRPHTGGRYDLKVLELSPGGGRFTAELLRYASMLDILDMNQSCLDVCLERFKYVPTTIRTFLNDGQSCSMIEDSDYDLIVCYDSMVHMHPEIIENYVVELGQRLAVGGIIWLDHAGKGAEDRGHRTDMTPSLMATYFDTAGLEVVEQRFRNHRDCISVGRRI